VGRALAATLILVAVAWTAAAADAGRFTYRGTVTRVVDGDTLVVRLATGASTRVRLIGVDTPERGACHAAEATRRTGRLALRRPVVLKGDPTQATRDRYGRLLAYAWIGGRDLGYRLVAGGFGRKYVYGRPFQRLGPYRQAEARAKAARRGLWGSCSQAAVTGGGGDCHPSYSPCLPVVADLDCADVRAMGKAPVRVHGTDPYRLDGDGDGLGCE
jgi:endonuclease YncB( thermonuclease family)